MKAGASFLGLTLWALLLPGAQGETPVAYYFYNFEEDAHSMKLGQPPGKDSGFQVLSGSAVIAADEAPGQGRNLTLRADRPFSAVVLSGARLTAKGKSHLEVWVRPTATEASRGEEFLDFDGAAVGLFRAADPRFAEVHAWHFSSKEDGWWISSGWRVRLDDAGRSSDWMRIGIVHDWQTSTWQMEINGAKVLEGIRRPADAVKESFELWLFGQESGDNLFDDILISPLPPAELEALAAVWHAAAGRTARGDAPTEPKRVSSAQAVQKRRQHQTQRRDKAPRAAPIILAMNATVVGGGKHLTDIDVKDSGGIIKRHGLYSPGYDADGKPIPLEIEIRCDADLGPGATLGDIRWAVTEQGGGKNDEELHVVVHGTFATGPTQIARLPSEWSNKALGVFVGKLDFKTSTDATALQKGH